MAKLLSGTALSKLVLNRVKGEVRVLADKGERKPGLGVVMVGDNHASKTYVASKERTAKECGFITFNTHLAGAVSMGEVLGTVGELNYNKGCDGILLQLPLPSHLNQMELIKHISPDKDVDGLHPVNQGGLLGGAEGFRPCTPLGALKLIDLAYWGRDISEAKTDDDIPRVDLAGKKAVVIGRSILVGKPVAILLLERNATVTIAHSKTTELDNVVRDADIVIAAVGRPKMVKGSWIKRGSVVIDVGINRDSNGKLVGDVDFEEVSKVAGAITPVPGGVGPMTVAMLMSNTVASCLNQSD